MKTKAFDPETKQWRTDYVVMPDGSIWRYEFSVFSGNRLVEKVDWKLSRFTGLLDKSGKEIYEDDIVGSGVEVHSCGGVTKYYRNCLVFWNTHDCAWNIKFRGECLNGGKYTQPVNTYRASMYYTIIGNIFQNPELLEV